MNLDADFRAEALAAETGRGPILAACAYLSLALGVTVTLGVIPSVIAMLAARGLH